MIRERIIEIIKAKQGIKGTELGARLAIEFIEESLADLDLIVNEMVERNELIQIRYKLENNWKSFYLPTNTMIEIK